MSIQKVQVERTILSTSDVARLFQVTETTVKRWADGGLLRCERTPGGHRKFDVRNLVEFANAQGLTPSGALALPEEDDLSTSIQFGVVTRNYPVLVNAFVQRALSPDKTDLYAFLSYMYQHRIELWEIFDRVLAPGMALIGEKWARREIGVNHEHRATNEILDALARLQSEVVIKSPEHVRAVCACPEEELHQIGLRCSAYLLESEGWTVHYLGGRTPKESIAASMRQVLPNVLCISVSAAMSETVLTRTLTYLHDEATTRGIKLIVGGGGAKPAFVDQEMCEAVATSSKELLSIASRITRGSQTHESAMHVKGGRE